MWQNVYVPLSVNEYKLACDAHRDNKRIQIEGIVERTGNQWKLMGAEHFRVE
ncbi:hypothetical protein EV213_1142 [Aureibacillus halotolerans]|uniref:Uncharacterized protein n=1 Tax=Aureibacillus halotolerans TaxID=1508390 RepID=A0A4R6TXN0_9BACI|nr:hypothetical protein EV213_1142 [Aureibacillus halotolerans]